MGPPPGTGKTKHDSVQSLGKRFPLRYGLELVACGTFFILDARAGGTYFFFPEEVISMKTQQSEKVDYEKPTIRDYGNLAQLTAGAHNGNFLDATFPVHTPKSALTFSG